MTALGGGVFETSPGRRELRASAVVVGGGPTGLTAARHLAQALPGRVVVLEREHEAGGVPRYCHHRGFGLRDLGGLYTGPEYAARLIDRAKRAGAVVRTDSTVTSWDGTGPQAALRVTAPDGLLTVRADVILLATGARERTRDARRVPGSRPQGVYTGGELAQLVRLNGVTVPGRAVIIGADEFSWPVVGTLRDGGAEPVLVTSEYGASHQSSTPGWSRRHWRAPVRHRTRVSRIIGEDAVEAVELEDLDSGERTVVECELVVFTADWIPEYELARSAGVLMDSATAGPVTDRSFRTDRTGLFAAGSLVHPVEAADVTALDGRGAARAMIRQLSSPTPSRGVRVLVDAPFDWVWPQVLAPDDGGLTRDRLLLRSREHIAFPTIEVRQRGELLSRRRVVWPIAPDRLFRLPTTHVDRIGPRGDVIISLG